MWCIHNESRGGNGARIERLLPISSNWKDFNSAGWRNMQTKTFLWQASSWYFQPMGPSPWSNVRNGYDFTLIPFYIAMFLPVWYFIGGSATLAVEVLKARGVPEDHILFLNIIASPSGVADFAERFPKLRVVTAFIDQGLDEKKCVIPLPLRV